MRVSAEVEAYIYPYAEKTESLPVCLRGIGGTEYQGYVREDTDSCWYKIIFCIRGRGRLNYGSESCEITRGDILLMPRGFPHEYYPIDRKWTVRWVVFDGCGIEDTLTQLGLNRPIVFKECSLKAVIGLFDEMLVALRADRINGVFRCSGLCYQLILELHSLLLDRVLPRSSSGNEILLPVLDHIEEHFRRDLPIGELVELSGVSHQYLGRIFRQAMNTSIEKYIRSRRLWEAKQLLLETDRAVSEIARMCGFSDAGYFSTVFRRAEGMPPEAYRRASRRKPNEEMKNERK